MRLKLIDLTWDKKIYPRNNKSDKTIDAYVEAVSVGALFPALKVQRVCNYKNGGDEPKEAWLVLDGVHRKHAYETFNKKDDVNKIEEVDADEWKPGAILDYQESWIELLLASSRFNTRHGDRVSQGDKETIAVTIAEADSDFKYTEEMIASELEVTRQTVNNWIKHIRTRQRAGRDNTIFRLSRLGRTQEEVAEIVTGLTQPRVQQIINNANFSEIYNFLEKGQSMEWICDHYNIDLTLAWSLRLEGKTDQERFGENDEETKKKTGLGWGLRTWDDWYFNKCDERFGDDWPGRIPAQLVAHTLFYFTNPGDLVLDPMAGGGVVPDTCLLFGRKCRAYDVAIRKERPEIQYHHWQLDNMAWPELKKKPDLIFFDPPYFTKKEQEYEEKAEGGESPISSLPREDYLRFFDQFFALARANVKPKGYIAFLNADWRDFQSTPAMQENHQNAITMLDYADLLKKNDWQITHIIDAPMSTQRFNAGVVSYMQKSRILGVVRRTLLVGKAI